MKKEINLIPKKIHYCWLGGNELSPLALKCIESWKKHCPDYEIIQWDESNIEIKSNKFMQEAYKKKKWGFVTDVARLDIIYKHGGIYLDTDVEIIKNFDDLLNLEAFIGFEGIEFVNTGSGFGAQKESPIIKKIRNIYDNIEFISDENGNYNHITTPILITDFLVKNGLMKNGEFQYIKGLNIFPEDYFNPKHPITRLINITNNTYSIHHFDASWVNEEEKKYIKGLDKEAKKIMATQKKLVSVIIPVYNGENYIKRAVDSVLNQTYKNIEIIVINDGSIDNTEKIVKEYGSRIRYYKKNNGGVSSALNLGIKNMRGYYFSWLSHDDEYHPQKIEEQVNCLKTADNNTICLCNWYIIDKNNEILSEKIVSKKIQQNFTAFLGFDRITWLNACSLLIPKQIFDKYGIFDEDLKSTQDYDLFFRISKKVKIKILENKLLYSRAHSEQGSLTMENALDQSDLIHYKIIDSLSYNEVNEYFDNKIENIYEVYDSFYNNGYKRTPAIILKHILIILDNQGQEQNSINLIYQKIFGIYNDKINDNSKVVDKYNVKTRQRLLFFSAHWLVGGVERVLSILFERLSVKYDIILITPYSENRGLKFTDKVVHFEISKNFFQNSYDFTLFAFIKIFKVDITIGCMNLFDKVLDFYYLLRGTEIKAIASNHEYYFYPYRNSYFSNIVNKRLSAYENLNAVLWLTNFSTKVYNYYNNNGYLMANPNTFDFKKYNIIKNKDQIVLAVGRFTDHIKRIDKILECFSYIVAREKNAKLLLVGKYDLNDKIINNLSINELMFNFNLTSNQVNFVGEQDDVSQYYKLAKVLISTSENEGFPMVFNEAGAYGVPVVCNDIPGIEDIIIDGVNGYITEQNDIQSMANKVIELLTNDKLNDKIGIQSMELVTRFKPEQICHQWEYLIDQVLKNDNNEILRKSLLDKLDCNIENFDKFSKQLATEINIIHFNNIRSGHQDLDIKITTSFYKKISNNIKLFYITKKDYGLKMAILKSVRKISRLINRKNKTF